MIEVEDIVARRSTEFKFDPAGFFYIYVDARRGEIVVEFYRNVKKKGSNLEVDTGRLDKIVRGRDAESISHTIAALGLITRIDHALYIGRELQKAELALKNGLSYEQGEGLDLKRRRKRK